MIEALLPLSRKKLEILKYIYENGPVHLRKISADLGIHPYQAKIIIDSLVLQKVLEQQKAGKTILLKMNGLFQDMDRLTYTIEDYKQRTDNKTLGLIIKNLKEAFAKNHDVLTCCLFGSYARGAQTKKSDVDVLIVIRGKNAEKQTLSRISQLGILLNLDFSPIIMDENEFRKTIESKEPAAVTMLKPSQRIIVTGLEYFLKLTVL